jgi:hypothetical protein
MADPNFDFDRMLEELKRSAKPDLGTTPAALPTAEPSPDYQTSYFEKVGLAMRANGIAAETEGTGRVGAYDPTAEPSFATFPPRWQWTLKKTPTPEAYLNEVRRLAVLQVATEEQNKNGFWTSVGVEMVADPAVWFEIGAGLGMTALTGGAGAPAAGASLGRRFGYFAAAEGAAAFMSSNAREQWNANRNTLRSIDEKMFNVMAETAGGAVIGGALTTGMDALFRHLSGASYARHRSKLEDFDKAGPGEQVERIIEIMDDEMVYPVEERGLTVPGDEGMVGLAGLEDFVGPRTIDAEFEIKPSGNPRVDGVVKMLAAPRPAELPAPRVVDPDEFTYTGTRSEYNFLEKEPLPDSAIGQTEAAALGKVRAADILPPEAEPLALPSRSMVPYWELNAAGRELTPEFLGMGDESIARDILSTQANIDDLQDQLKTVRTKIFSLQQREERGAEYLKELEPLQALVVDISRKIDTQMKRALVAHQVMTDRQAGTLKARERLLEIDEQLTALDDQNEVYRRLQAGGPDESASKFGYDEKSDAELAVEVDEVEEKLEMAAGKLNARQADPDMKLDFDGGWDDLKAHRDELIERLASIRQEMRWREQFPEGAGLSSSVNERITEITEKRRALAEEAQGIDMEISRIMQDKDIEPDLASTKHEKLVVLRRQAELLLSLRSQVRVLAIQRMRLERFMSEMREGLVESTPALIKRYEEKLKRNEEEFLLTGTRMEDMYNRLYGRSEYRWLREATEGDPRTLHDQPRLAPEHEIMGKSEGALQSEADFWDKQREAVLFEQQRRQWRRVEELMEKETGDEDMRAWTLRSFTPDESQLRLILEGSTPEEVGPLEFRGDVGQTAPNPVVIEMMREEGLVPDSYDAAELHVILEGTAIGEMMSQLGKDWSFSGDQWEALKAYRTFFVQLDDAFWERRALAGDTSEWEEFIMEYEDRVVALAEAVEANNRATREAERQARTLNDLMVRVWDDLSPAERKWAEETDAKLLAEGHIEDSMLPAEQRRAAMARAEGGGEPPKEPPTADGAPDMPEEEPKRPTPGSGLTPQDIENMSWAQKNAIADLLNEITPDRNFTFTEWVEKMGLDGIADIAELQQWMAKVNANAMRANAKAREMGRPLSDHQMTMMVHDLLQQRMGADLIRTGNILKSLLRFSTDSIIGEKFPLFGRMLKSPAWSMMNSDYATARLAVRVYSNIGIDAADARLNGVPSFDSIFKDLNDWLTAAWRRLQKTSEEYGPEFTNLISEVGGTGKLPGKDAFSRLVYEAASYDDDILRAISGSRRFSDAVRLLKERPDLAEAINKAAEVLRRDHTNVLRDRMQAANLTGDVTLDQRKAETYIHIQWDNELVRQNPGIARALLDQYSEYLQSRGEPSLLMQERQAIFENLSGGRADQQIGTVETGKEGAKNSPISKRRLMVPQRLEFQYEGRWYRATDLQENLATAVAETGSEVTAREVALVEANATPQTRGMSGLQKVLHHNRAELEKRLEEGNMGIIEPNLARWGGRMTNDFAPSVGALQEIDILDEQMADALKAHRRAVSQLADPQAVEVEKARYKQEIAELKQKRAELEARIDDAELPLGVVLSKADQLMAESAAIGQRARSVDAADVVDTANAARRRHLIEDEVAGVNTTVAKIRQMGDLAARLTEEIYHLKRSMQRLKSMGSDIIDPNDKRLVMRLLDRHINQRRRNIKELNKELARVSKGSNTAIGARPQQFSTVTEDTRWAYDGDRNQVVKEWDDLADNTWSSGHNMAKRSTNGVQWKRGLRNEFEAKIKAIEEDSTLTPKQKRRRKQLAEKQYKAMLDYIEVAATRALRGTRLDIRPNTVPGALYRVGRMIGATTTLGWAPLTQIQDFANLIRHTKYWRDIHPIAMRQGSDILLGFIQRRLERAGYWASGRGKIRSIKELGDKLASIPEKARNQIIAEMRELYDAVEVHGMNSKYTRHTGMITLKQRHGEGFVEKGAESIEGGFFNLIGFGAVNREQKAFTSLIVENKLGKILENKRKLTKSDLEFLEHLGITEDMLGELRVGWVGEQVRSLIRPKWDDMDPRVSAMLRRAVARFVDNNILQPGVLDSPGWADSNIIGAFAFQLSSFVHANANRGVRASSASRMKTHKVAMWMFFMGVLGAMRHEIKSFLIRHDNEFEDRKSPSLIMNLAEEAQGKNPPAQERWEAWFTYLNNSGVLDWPIKNSEWIGMSGYDPIEEAVSAAGRLMEGDPDLHIRRNDKGEVYRGFKSPSGALGPLWNWAEGAGRTAIAGVRAMQEKSATGHYKFTAKQAEEAQRLVPGSNAWPVELLGAYLFRWAQEEFPEDTSGTARTLTEFMAEKMGATPE